MEIELARQLLNIPSVSGEEKEIAEFLVDRLSRTFKVETQNVGNNFNILATCGKPDIILTTHMDTVPGLLEIKEDNDYLYGRGACDTKGIIAAMVCACEEAVKEGFNNLLEKSPSILNIVSLFFSVISLIISVYLFLKIRSYGK